MKIAWLVPCRYAEPHSDGTMSIVGAGIDTFWLPEANLPAQVGFMLAVRVVGTDDEGLLDPHTLTIGLRRPTGEREEIVRADFQLDSDRTIEGTPPGILVRIVVAISISEFGLHQLEVAVDGRDAQHIPLRALDERARTQERATGTFR